MRRRLRPLRAPEGVGGGSANPLPDTTGQIEEATTDVTDSFERLAKAIEGIAPHLEKLVSEGLTLHPIEAARQIPEAAGEVATGAGEAAGDAAQAAGHVAGAVPAVATDTLDTAGGAGSAVVKKARRYTIRKGRR